MSLLQTGELGRRASGSVAEMARCAACPRACGVDRLAGHVGVCRTGRYARVASYFPHFGEEDCLRGWNGSGTIFFGGCNLRCVFCQNADISQHEHGEEAPAERIASMMLDLQERGCHNINLVTPEHVVPQVLEALAVAAGSGLRLPIVYNTSAYDSLESLARLDGVVDIYMPDFKLWDPAQCLKYLKARDYPSVARAALKEMHRQVGALRFDRQGLARRGVLVRHLVMPGPVAGTEEILQFLAREVSPETYVNLMAQYRPAGSVGVGRYDEINRRVTVGEYREAVRTASDLGLRLDTRDGA